MLEAMAQEASEDLSFGAFADSATHRTVVARPQNTTMATAAGELIGLDWFVEELAEPAGEALKAAEDLWLERQLVVTAGVAVVVDKFWGISRPQVTELVVEGPQVQELYAEL